MSIFHSGVSLYIVENLNYIYLLKKFHCSEYSIATIPDSNFAEDKYGL